MVIHLWIKRSLKLGGEALYGRETNPSTFPGLKPGVCSELLLHFDFAWCPELVEGSGAFGARPRRTGV